MSQELYSWTSMIMAGEEAISASSRIIISQPRDYVLLDFPIISLTRCSLSWKKWCSQSKRTLSSWPSLAREANRRREKEQETEHSSFCYLHQQSTKHWLQLSTIVIATRGNLSATLKIQIELVRWESTYDSTASDVLQTGEPRRTWVRGPL